MQIDIQDLFKLHQALNSTDIEVHLVFDGEPAAHFEFRLMDWIVASTKRR